ncbi:carbohydrate kinase, YjeF related protein [Acidimicrobium ferrooxidans DSM 10331]|uniref:ADP-dependent (S)-NAD(P)H-hydrate dehydratase n=1 Tax=Acidimicrobium ferrooxidans (strain DSM 10331 / JCM 15462 / NBRC 103882 / ICP) TaxID=525909 RepID=C7M310_ACIFD|nr:NAD(P)H-hydrate dehydratase [Acidimicrobium ferrooxidans]ACU53404.1 carbohydrate kinase, YjeF related protein [Acidimicrobium ferrooxidans DSM 10331]
MQPIVRRAGVRALDERLAREGLVDATIERVGRAVARELRRSRGGLYGTRVVVIAGPGNNGRDGVATARALAGWGASVRVESLRDVVAGAATSAIGTCDLVVDAALGTGPARPLSPLGLEGVPEVVAIDIPSGIDADTGEVTGADLGGVAVVAHRTITVGALKPGLLVGEGPEHAGAIVRVLDDLVPEDVDAWLVERDDVGQVLPRPGRDAHKWRSGLFVLGGSPGMRGAPAFVARGARAVGAGIVHVLTRSEPMESVALEIAPEVVARRLVTGHVDLAVAEAERFGAAVIGPGLGDTLASANLVRRVVSGLGVPFVLDADGLTSLAGEGRLASVLAQRRAPGVITPHDGELARVAPHLGGTRIERAKGAAAEFGVVVVAKGNPTVVAAPSGETMVVAAGTARLASAGTGDVLAGVIGGLLAQGLDPLRAAWAGAWLHGTAGAQLAMRLAAPTALADAIGRLVAQMVPIPAHPGASVEARP